MTNDEAIKRIEEELSLMELTSGTLPLTPNEQKAYEAFKMGKDALKYRTPKKVLVDSRDCSDGRKLIIYGCPACERWIPHKGREYCSHCGQALDWTEVK